MVARGTGSRLGLVVAAGLAALLFGALVAANVFVCLWLALVPGSSRMYITRTFFEYLSLSRLGRLALIIDPPPLIRKQGGNNKAIMGAIIRQ